MVGFGRRRCRGAGLGDSIAEIAVIAVIIGGIVMAGRWYFVVYRHSPSYTLQRFVSDINLAHTDDEYDLLSSSSQASMTKQQFSDKSLAAGLSSRIANFVVKDVKVNGDRAIATVTVTVRQLGGPIYEANANTYNDRYVLVREGGDWKVQLASCYLASFQPARR